MKAGTCLLTLFAAPSPEPVCRWQGSWPGERVNPEPLQLVAFPSPVPESYLVGEKTDVYLFINQEHLTASIHFIFFLISLMACAHHNVFAFSLHSCVKCAIPLNFSLKFFHLHIVFLSLYYIHFVLLSRYQALSVGQNSKCVLHAVRSLPATAVP